MKHIFNIDVLLERKQMEVTHKEHLYKKIMINNK